MLCEAIRKEESKTSRPAPSLALFPYTYHTSSVPQDVLKRDVQTAVREGIKSPSPLSRGPHFGGVIPEPSRAVKGNSTPDDFYSIRTINFSQLWPQLTSSVPQANRLPTLKDELELSHHRTPSAALPPLLAHFDQTHPTRGSILGKLCQALNSRHGWQDPIGGALINLLYEVSKTS